MAVRPDEHEVKGIWFVAAREYVRERHGDERYARLLERLPSEVAEALRDPLSSQWYPEGHLAAYLQAVFDELAAGDPERFLEETMATAEQGMGRFFRGLLQMSTPAFILKQSPTTWRLMRRGPGTMHAERVPGGTLLTYRRFPHFGNQLYRLLAIGSVRALVHRSTGSEVTTEIRHWSDEELDLFVAHD